MQNIIMNPLSPHTFHLQEMLSSRPSQNDLRYKIIKLNWPDKQTLGGTPGPWKQQLSHCCGVSSLRGEGRWASGKRMHWGLWQVWAWTSASQMVGLTLSDPVSSRLFFHRAAVRLGEIVLQSPWDFQQRKWCNNWIYTQKEGRRSVGFSDGVCAVGTIQLFPQGTDQGQMGCVPSKTAFFQYKDELFAQGACQNSLSGSYGLCCPWEPERSKVKAQRHGPIPGFGSEGLLTPGSCWHLHSPGHSLQQSFPATGAREATVANTLHLFPNGLFSETQKKAQWPPTVGPT